MSDFTKMCSEAASWMLRREEKKEDGMHYWRWTVLTEHNTDPDSPKFSEKNAFLIFADFVQRGMLVPCIGDGGNEAFTINHGKDDEWNQIASPGRHLLWTWGQRAFDWVMGGIVGAIIGAIAMACIG